jgi:BCCT family betaine/carnitine transporter
MFMGGLSTLQTAAIVGGLPLLGISIMLMVSAVRATTLDIRHQEDYIEPTINIEELPEFDPWSTEGMAMARFERARDAAQEAAEQERDALAQLMTLRKRIRAFALEHSDDNDFADHHLPQDMQEELQALLDNVMKAKERKLELSETAQQSRAEFNQIVAQSTSYAV